MTLDEKFLTVIQHSTRKNATSWGDKTQWYGQQNYVQYKLWPDPITIFLLLLHFSSLFSHIFSLFLLLSPLAFLLLHFSSCISPLAFLLLHFSSCISPLIIFYQDFSALLMPSSSDSLKPSSRPTLQWHKPISLDQTAVPTHAWIINDVFYSYSGPRPLLPCPSYCYHLIIAVIIVVFFFYSSSSSSAISSIPPIVIIFFSSSSSSLSSYSSFLNLPPVSLSFSDVINRINSIALIYFIPTSHQAFARVGSGSEQAKHFNMNTHETDKQFVRTSA